MTLQEFLLHFPDARPCGSGYKTRCPAHKDNEASLQISPGEKVPIVLRCHASCETQDILSALGLSLKDISTFPNGTSHNKKKNGLTVWPIRDITGQTIAHKNRGDSQNGKKKRIFWTDASGKNGLNGLPPKALPLYNSESLPDYDRKKPLFLLEGEKDTDALLSLGIQAVGTVGGAGVTPSLEVLETIADFQDVRPWPDHDSDGKGYRHMQRVAARLITLGCTPAILTPPPELPEGGGAADWVTQERNTNRNANHELRADLEQLPRNVYASGGGVAEKTPRPKAGAKPNGRPAPRPYAGARPAPRPDSPRPGVGGNAPGGLSDPTGLTDTGNALRLVYLALGEIRYCYRWGKWLAWNGQRWEEDEEGEPQRWAEKAARSFAEDAADILRGAREGSNEEQKYASQKAETLLKWGRTSLSAGKVSSALELAKAQKGVPIRYTEMDCNPWLFGCANGTIDLRTGELRPHRKEDLLTKVSPVAYDPKAKCPTWLAFLDTIQAGDQELIGCLQRGVGYSLSGSVREQVLFFLHGRGSNGKSTFLDAVLFVLGDYGMRALPELLMSKRQQTHPTDRAQLFGARLASCQEVQEGARWDEERVKELTGETKITARRMREDPWTFTATHKLWVSGNHKPRVRGTDHAIWRRIKLLPFTVTIPKEEQDTNLPEKLQREADGILRWAVEGCLTWQARGLDFPHAVEEATRSYRESEDVCGRFLEDCCLIERKAQSTSKDLYDAYGKWCEQEGEHSLNKRAFGEQLEERGFTPRRGTGGVRGWQGIGLLHT